MRLLWVVHEKSTICTLSELNRLSSEQENDFRTILIIGLGIATRT